jgi:hypothetical protein
MCYGSADTCDYVQLCNILKYVAVLVVFFIYSCSYGTNSEVLLMRFNKVKGF